MSKDIIFGEQLHKKCSEAIDLIHKAVSSTLGPGGRLALLNRGTGNPTLITKDGVTVANRCLPLRDPVLNQIAEKLFEIAFKTGQTVGDGTTTSIVLTKALYDEAISKLNKKQNTSFIQDLKSVFKKEEAKISLLDLKIQMNKIIKKVLAELDEMAIPVSGIKDMTNIATISANGDKVIGEITAQAVDAAGQDGFIDLEISDSAKTELKITEGMVVPKGVTNIRFLKNKNTLELDNPYVLVVDGKIEDINIIDGLNISYLNGRPLIVVSEVGDLVFKYMMSGTTQGRFTIVHVDPPNYKNTRHKMMEDLCVYTGAAFINPEDQNLACIRKDQLGSAKRAVLTLSTMNLINGAGDKKKILDRIDNIKAEMDQHKSQYDKDICKDRIGRLTATSVIVSIGGYVEEVAYEAKDRFDDALNATRSAFDGGIIPGGGYALWSIANKLKAENPGEEAVLNAIKAPIKKIISNTGADVETVLAGLTSTQGYDARNHKYCDLLESGIVDPKKVAATALMSAMSMVELLISLEVLTYEKPESQFLDFLGNMAATNTGNM
jgi:chaperonin GroEL